MIHGKKKTSITVKLCSNYVGYSWKILKSLDSISIEFCLKSRLTKGSYQTDFYPCCQSTFKTKDLLQNSDFCIFCLVKGLDFGLLGNNLRGFEDILNICLINQNNRPILGPFLFKTPKYNMKDRNLS